jgi:histidine ammonia-lyase
LIGTEVARSLATVPVQLGRSLSLADVTAVARGEAVALPPDAVERMRASRALVEEKVRSNETVYGVTTGFGSLADVRIEPERAATLQGRIVRSHATSVGPPLPRDEARAMLLLRAHVLALAYSGVRVEIVERMVEMLNRDLIPFVPEQGSLGASGDLAPLASLALPLIGSGHLLADDGSSVGSAEVLSGAGLQPLQLEAKEGLALVNGTQGMLAIGALACERLRDLVRVADIVAAMTIEAALGTDRPFDERLQRLRPHPGGIASAANLRALMSGSEIVASHRASSHLVQDAYSLRCTPQVHGAVRGALAYAEEVLGIEANAVSDNPIVLADDGEILAGGNFHGQPVAVPLDAAALASVSFASVAERRLYRLLDPAANGGLPAFLVPESGLNSGFMLAQYTAASLVSESKALAHPASVDSIPSSAGQEDHVSMGMTAARHLRACVANAQIVVAIELLAAAQALDLRSPLVPGVGSRAGRAALREVVPFLDEDRELGPDLHAAIELVRGGELLDAVVTAVGPLR